MNKIGLNKKFRMGWNDYVRLMSLKHFPSLSCDLSHTTTMLMLIMTLMTLTFNTTKTFAQTFGTTYEAADNIDQLVGIDPSDEYITETNGINTNIPTTPIRSPPTRTASNTHMAESPTSPPTSFG